jgi:hypothetical protein
MDRDFELFQTAESGQQSHRLAPRWPESSASFQLAANRRFRAGWTKPG